VRRVVVLAADSPLGRSIVDEASTRALELTAVVRDPLRWPSPSPVSVIRGDLLDLTCPERLIGGGAVVVVPFGSSDSSRIDFAADLHVATVLGHVSERVGSATTRFVLAGRASAASATEHVAGPRTRRVDDGGRQLAEHAVLAVYATFADLQWEYVSPSGRIRAQEVSGPPDRLLAASQRLFATRRARPIADYLATIVDSVEHHLDQVSPSASSAATPGGSRVASPSARATARQET